MNPPSLDIAQKLMDDYVVAQGHAFVGADPIDFMDAYVTVTDTGGTANPKWLRDTPSVQIRVRGRPNEYPEAYTLMRTVRDYLLGIDPFTVGDAIYARIVMVADIMFVGYDPASRPVFSINLQLTIDGTNSTGTNREVIA